ncbi:MAG: hypothetical protein AABW71_01625 [Nanoarchaeota archaeon]
MDLNFEKARAYLLSQPFVEDLGAWDVLRFNVYAIPRTYTPLDERESAFGRATSRTFPSIPLFKIFDKGKGKLNLFLDSSSKGDDYLGYVSLGVVEDPEMLFPGLNLIHPISKLICLDAILRGQLAKDLAKKHSLEVLTGKDTGGVTVSTGELKEIQELQRLLDFGVEYSRLVYNSKFLEEVASLSEMVDEELGNISKKLSENQ